MDIEYLLMLQNFREGAGDFLSQFFETVSAIVINPLFLWLLALLYWLLDKRTGGFVFLTWGVSEMFSQLLKLTACVYRPWIRDSRILPAGDAISTATGYSFPSGHTNAAVSLYGAPAISYRKKNPLAVLYSLFSRAAYRLFA